MTQETLQPSQRAREAAAALMHRNSLAILLKQGGDDDHPFVQAFARFERSILAEHSDGVVTCPICGDDNSPCKVCNGHGFLTTEEAAGWLLAQRDVSEHDSRVEKLEAENERLRISMTEVLPYIEEGYIEGDPDDEPIGWQADNDGSNQRPIPITMGMIRRFRSALNTTQSGE